MEAESSIGTEVPGPYPLCGVIRETLYDIGAFMLRPR